jgi:endonuclease/exonuclease/phosphatase family metal-dependent hydrolase
MTYNVCSFDKGKTNASLEALARIIKAEDPDIIALQEVADEGQLRAFIMMELGGQYPHVVFPPQQAASSHRLAFISKENIRVVDSKSHLNEQNAPEGYRQKRDFLEATFETETGYRLKLFNAHFNAKHPEVRLEEATTAANLLRTILARNPAERFLVAGDLNSRPNCENGPEVIDTLSLKKDDDPANDLTETLHMFIPPPKAVEGDDAIKTSPSGFRDHMLASPGLLPEVKNAYVVGQIRTLPWSQASDHLPVVTEIEEPDDLPKPAATAAEIPQFGTRLNRVA